MWKFCAYPGCPTKTPTARCPKHTQQQERDRPLFDARRWYRTTAWARLRRQVFTRDGYTCKDCQLVTAYPHCDHIIPHRADKAKFFDINNLQTMCGACHGRKTQGGA
jgi:5-methylcytosine-specific restriction protein A